MTRVAGRRIVTRALLAAAILSLLPLVVPVPGARAAAAETEPTAVRVILDRLTPAAPRPGRTLRISGRLHNRSADPVTDLSVRLRLSTVPVLTRGELEQLAVGESEPDDVGLDSTTVALEDLPGGRTIPFTIQVPLDDLNLGPFGVYPIGVEARGSTALGFDRVGITRTFLPWAPDPIQARPTRLVWIWPLADRPRRKAGGTFVDDSLARSLSTGGRLAGLVDAGAGHPEVTWLLDPMLLDDAEDMSDGYAVIAGPDSTGAGPTVPGSGDEAARIFLERLTASVGGAGVMTLPYGDLDVVAAGRHRLPGLLPDALARARATAARILDWPVAAAATMPPGGWLNNATARLLERAGLRTVVLAGGALAPVDLTYTPTGRASVPVAGGEPLAAMLFDERLGEVVRADTSRAGTRVLAQQRFLAETAMVTAERPADQRTIAVAPPVRWAPSAEHAEALLDLSEQVPWLEPVRLADALALPPPDIPRAPLDYPRTARRAELSGRYLSAVRNLHRSVDTVTDVLSDGAVLTLNYRVEQLRLASAGLRRADSLRRRLLEITQQDLANTLTGIRVLPTSVQLPARDSVFPVTVVNDLDQPVSVRLTLSASSPKLSVGQPDPVVVDAGGKKQVPVPAEAIANGLVTVQAQLTTPDGTPIGVPTEIRVQVAQYGGAALFVTGGAALLLFVAAARNVVRRIRAPGPRRHVS